MWSTTPRCVIHNHKVWPIYLLAGGGLAEWSCWWTAGGQSVWSTIIKCVIYNYEVCSKLISLLVDAWQSDLANEVQWDKVCGPQLWSMWSTITKCDLPISLLVKAKAILLMSCRGTKCVIHKSRALHESVPVFSDRWAFMSNPHMDTQPSCESKHADDKTAWVCPPDDKTAQLVSLKTAEPSCPVPT